MIRVFLTSALVCLAFIFIAGQSFAATELFKDVCPTDPPSPVCQEAAKTTASNQDNPLSGPNGVIQTAANIVAMVTGILAVIMIIISGLVFIAAGGTGFKSQSGTPTRAAKARAMLAYSVIGLVIVAAAWTIITFVNTNLVNT